METLLTNKLKLLSFTTKDLDQIIKRRKERELQRKQKDIEKTLEDIYSTKLSVIEEKIVAEETRDNIDAWCSEIDHQISDYEEVLEKIKDEINSIKEEIENDNLEKERREADERAERELEEQMKIHTMKLDMQKEMERKKAESGKSTRAKLPKLEITKFKGTYIDWPRFWGQFEAEIEKSDIQQVTKFSYLKELLVVDVKKAIEGLPFTAEGYARAKTILKHKYGKESEIINAHIQQIMQLPTIHNSSIGKIKDFYEVLLMNIQALQTMGKLHEINGYVRMTIDKLPSIRSDLVRNDDEWQNWKFPKLVEELRKWSDRNPTVPEIKKEQIRSRDKFFAAQQEGISRKCVYCNEDHKPTSCEKIKDISERRRILSSKQLCFNCTRSGHRATECKSRSCYNCRSRHHTSICDKKSAAKRDPMYSVTGGAVVYPVVTVMVNGTKCRALLDTGAGSCYVSSKLIDYIGIQPKRREHRKIEMLMHTASKKVSIYNVAVSNTFGDFSINCEVSKVDKDVLLTIPNPNYKQLIETHGHLKGVNIEDQETKPELPVHMILGANVYARIKMKELPRVAENGSPIAERTRFGWVIMSPGAEVESRMYLIQSSPSDYDRLCRLDVLGIEDRPEGDQATVYDEFKEQLKRDQDGWYETGLMWKAAHPELPNNKAASVARLKNLLRRLGRNPKLMEEYDEKIQEQLENGIVEEAPQEPEGIEFYMPHKPVLRESAESTKLRIVYDASCRPDERSPTLNECLEPGPPLQKRLWDILTRNRMRPVILAGDIKQAFLQIRIKKEHRDALRFHWITDKVTLQPRVLRFTRAVFGIIQSPFLLGGTLEYHLDQYKEPYQTTAEIIKEDTYVDDVIGGGDTITEVKDLKQKIIKICGEAKFQLHKWHSNIPELASTEEENKSMSDSTYTKQLFDDEKKESAILGVPWNEQDDTIGVSIHQKETEATKRGVLKFLAAVYDPLGIISPIMLKGKLLYRDICDQKLSWDKPLTDDLWRRWINWKQYLPTQVKIPRSIPAFKAKINSVQLHAFADASKDGTSVALYAVVHQDEGKRLGLLGSKSRLAKKNLTIPRLELVAAHMAANMIENAREALARFPVDKAIAWSDSTVVLHWIKGGGQYKQFVHNRVKKIKEKGNILWRHISTEENPADIGSRGCRGDKLKQSWFEGPSWLGDETQWPNDITTTKTEQSETETKKIKEIMATSTESVDAISNLLEKFMLWKVLRITSWMKRFVQNCKAKKSDRKKGPLTTEEIEISTKFWVKCAQTNHADTDKFKDDRERLNLQKNEEGIYLCMGRVEGDYPMYLPAKDLFSEKIVERAHLKTLHGGAGFTITEVRQKYWIPQLRRMTKGVIYRCRGCKRFHAVAFTRPREGNLPKDRTQGKRPFQVIGVDFAGPFYYSKDHKLEGKAYVLLYTCSLTRAIYIDVLPDQTLEELLISIKAFIARRNRPEKIYSDNFSSFTAAAKWIKKIMKEEEMHEFLANENIKWQFNLSRAPWWGGQFERLVGLMKQTLYKVLGKAKPRLRELKSVLLDVETTLNNRPLGYIEDDVQSVILTPNVMMFDYPVNIPEEEDIDEEASPDLKKRYKYLKACRQRVWKRWTNEYLKYLRERHNLVHHSKALELDVGDIVIIRGDERNRAHWKTGIVDTLIKGKDGIVRAARLRAGKNHLERAVEHLYPLELTCDTWKDNQQNNRYAESLNPTANDFRPRRNAAEIARILKTRVSNKTVTF